MKNRPHGVSAAASLTNTAQPGILSLLDFSPDVICILDKEGRFLQVSTAVKAVWGYDPGELTGQYLLDFVAVEDRQSTVQAFATAMSGTALKNFQNYMYCQDGSLKPTTWSGKWNTEHDMLVCIGRDGTERAGTEKKAAQNEQRLYRACKMSKMGWWEWHSQPDQLYVSDELLAIYGWSSTRGERFTLETFLSLVHPDDRAQVQDNWTTNEQAPYFQYEHRLIRPSGEVVHILHYVHTIRNEAFEIIEAHGTARDITQDKTSESALVESQKRLEQIVESLGDGFYSLDRSWNFTYWNRRAEEMTGVKREKVLGKNVWKLYPEVTALKLYGELHRAMEENISVRSEEFFPVSGIWAEINAYPSGEGLSVYVRDITGQKKLAEERCLFDEKLRQTRNNLHNVLESMSDGFYTVDRHWNITFATDRVAAMIGVKKEDYIGKNHWQCFPTGVHNRFYTEYHRAFAENTLVCFEEFLPSFKRWVEVNVYPTPNELSVYVKDITDRKRQEKRLEFMAKATSGIIWERALDSDVVEINSEKLQQLFGYEVAGNSIPLSFWLENVHPDDTAIIEQNRTYALEYGLDFYLNAYRFKRKEGSWAYVKNRIYILRGEDGKPLSLIGAIEDVTGKRRAEEALIESEESYRLLFNNAPLANVISDVKTLRILDANTAALEQYGYSREELLDMTILDLHPQEDHEKVRMGSAGLKLNTRNSVGTATNLKKGGEKMLVEISVTIINYRGRPAALATLKDVTERVRLQELLVEQEVNHQKTITKAAIEAQEKERSEIGKELHDNVNQLLATAKLYIENIKYYPEQSSLFIEKGTSLVQNSINEIRRLSRALVTPTISDVGFKETLHELVTSYKELNLFEVVCGCDFDEILLDKEVRLTIYRILQEAFNNTVKYARASLVHVSMKCSPTRMQLTYYDDGVGFDPATIKKGVGLNNIKNRAEAYKAAVQITSSPGKGCRIAITFPVGEEPGNE